MDDGGRLSYNKDYVRKGLTINTQGFTFDEVRILCSNINLTYSLDAWVKQNKKMAVITISGNMYSQIKSIIFPEIIPSMRYKLPFKGLEKIDITI